MMGAPNMRSPATLAGGNRAEVSIRNNDTSTIADSNREANFAVLYIARRSRLLPCLAQAVAILADLGRALS